MRVLELHAPVSAIGRKSGRTATAAAAYRAAARIECERTGQIHDYTRKQGVEAEMILLPDNAPDWAHDRASLWNAAELRETRKDARTAREIQVALPAEFTPEERKEAGLRIGQLLVHRYNVGVDMAWHTPSRKGDERNHHVHILFTSRHFENGDWAEKKDRRLDDKRTGPEEIKVLREAVATVMNDIAAREHRDVYVEHLSYESRGHDLEPTQHLGPNATEMERRGVSSDIGNKNREIRARNQRRQQLYRRRNVIDLQTERERRRQRGKPSPAPSQDQSNDQIAQNPQGKEFRQLYADTQTRRRALLQHQEAKYGNEEKQLARQMAGVYAANERGYIVRFWRSISGRARRDRQEMASAQERLNRIAAEKRAAAEQFERERVARLEKLRADMRSVQEEAEARVQEPKVKTPSNQLGPKATSDTVRDLKQTSPAIEPDADIEPTSPEPESVEYEEDEDYDQGYSW